MAMAPLAVESTEKMRLRTKPKTVAFELLVDVSGHAQVSAHGSQYPQSPMSYEDARFAVKVVLVSGPTTTDAKDVKESLGLRLMSVRIVSVSFGDGTPREGCIRGKL